MARLLPPPFAAALLIALLPLSLAHSETFTYNFGGYLEYYDYESITANPPPGRSGHWSKVVIYGEDIDIDLWGPESQSYYESFYAWGSRTINFAANGGGPIDASMYSNTYYPYQGYYNATFYFVADPINTPPTVSLSASASSIAEGQSVTVTASASDPGGSVARIEFHRDGSLAHTVYSASGSYIYSNASAGSRSFFARAFDNLGAQADSNTVNVSVSANAPPSASLSASASTIEEGQSVTVTASASDPGGSVARIEFYRDGSLAHTVYSASGSYTYSNASAGSRSFFARAFDNLGAQADSNTVNVTVTAFVNALPTVDSFYTVPSTVLAGSQISVHLEASDVNGNLSAFAVRHVGYGVIHNNGVAGEPISGGSLVRDFNWTVPGHAGAGTHTMRVEVGDAYSQSGNASTYAIMNIPFTVTSPNVAPSISLSASPANPAEGQTVTVTATASDTDGSVAEVKIVQGGTVMGVFSAPPYQVSYAQGSPGSRAFIGVAKDDDGATTNTPDLYVDWSNAAPSASLSFSSSSPYEGESVTITASGSDAAGGVASTVLYMNGSQVASGASSAAYAYAMGSPGSASFHAVVDDGEGAATQSSTEWLSWQNASPTASLSVSSTSLTEGDSVTVSASGSDPSGSVSSVAIFRDGSQVASGGTSASYSDSLGAPGSRTYYAATSDGEGGSDQSGATEVTWHNAPPTMTSFYASASTIVQGGSVTLHASASDAAGGISEIRFFRNGAQAASFPSSSASYTYSAAAAGSHSFHAVAIDEEGSSVQSSTATVTVDLAPNQPPSALFYSYEESRDDYQLDFLALETYGLGFEVEASDSDGTIQRVELVSGSTVLDSETFSGQSSVHATLEFPVGSHGVWNSVHIRVQDDRGDWTAAEFDPPWLDPYSPLAGQDYMRVTVDGAPAAVISLSNPGAAYFELDAIFFGIAASDPENQISKVEYYLDGAMVRRDTAAPYDYFYYPAQLGASRTMVAKIFDIRGNRSDSNAIAFSVGPLEQAPGTLETHWADGNNDGVLDRVVDVLINRNNTFDFDSEAYGEQTGAMSFKLQAEYDDPDCYVDYFVWWPSFRFGWDWFNFRMPSGFYIDYDCDVYLDHLFANVALSSSDAPEGAEFAIQTRARPGSGWITVAQKAAGALGLEADIGHWYDLLEIPVFIRVVRIIRGSGSTSGPLQADLDGDGILDTYHEVEPVIRKVDGGYEVQADYPTGMGGGQRGTLGGIVDGAIKKLEDIAREVGGDIKAAVIRRDPDSIKALIVTAANLKIQKWIVAELSGEGDDADDHGGAIGFAGAALIPKWKSEYQSQRSSYLGYLNVSNTIVGSQGGTVSLLFEGGSGDKVTVFDSPGSSSPSEMSWPIESVPGKLYFQGDNVSGSMNDIQMKLRYEYSAEDVYGQPQTYTWDSQVASATVFEVNITGYAPGADGVEIPEESEDDASNLVVVVNDDFDEVDIFWYTEFYSKVSEPERLLKPDNSDSKIQLSGDYPDDDFHKLTLTVTPPLNIGVASLEDQTVGIDSVSSALSFYRSNGETSYGFGEFAADLSQPAVSGAMEGMASGQVSVIVEGAAEAFGNEPFKLRFKYRVGSLEVSDDLQFYVASIKFLRHAESHGFDEGADVVLGQERLPALMVPLGSGGAGGSSVVTVAVRPSVVADKLEFYSPDPIGFSLLGPSGGSTNVTVSHNSVREGDRLNIRLKPQGATQGYIMKTLLVDTLPYRTATMSVAATPRYVGESFVWMPSEEEIESVFASTWGNQANLHVNVVYYDNEGILVDYDCDGDGKLDSKQVSNCSMNGQQYVTALEYGEIKRVRSDLYENYDIALFFVPMLDGSTGLIGFRPTVVGYEKMLIAGNYGSFVLQTTVHEAGHRFGVRGEEYDPNAREVGHSRKNDHLMDNQAGGGSHLRYVDWREARDVQF